MDHSAVKLDNMFPNEKLSLGPSHWRFNTRLLESEEYVKTINESILKWKRECNNNDSFIILEHLNITA